MARIIILGTAAAVNDSTHDYTHFLLQGEQDTPVLVDAGANPLGKLKELELPDEAVRDMVLTHFHSDHVGDIPNIFMHMWLMGRTASMRIYGVEHCISRVQDMMSYHSWEEWPNFFPVAFWQVPYEDNAFVMENADFTIHAFPVVHYIPTVGLRIVNKHNGRVLGYSCDTEPCPSALKIAHNADILIHEAAGPPPGHSTARQAGETATRAGAKSLYLIHYQVWNTDPDLLVDEARQTFDGPVTLLRDLDEIEF
jgi:ribonuclease Z